MNAVPDITNVDDRKIVVRKLLEWQAGQTHFTCRFFDLYASADSRNRKFLAEGFPLEASVFDEWNTTGGDVKAVLRKRYGL